MDTTVDNMMSDERSDMEWTATSTNEPKRTRILQDQTNRTYKTKPLLKQVLSTTAMEDVDVPQSSCSEIIAQVNATLEPCYAQDIHQAHLDNEVCQIRAPEIYLTFPGTRVLYPDYQNPR